MRLKDFKVLKDNGDHYVVGHPQGKSFPVKKAGLSPKAHQELVKMSEGGEVYPSKEDGEPVLTSVDQSPEEALAQQEDSDGSQPKTQATPFTHDSNGYHMIHGYDEGGEVEDDADEESEPPANPSQAPAPLPPQDDAGSQRDPAASAGTQFSPFIDTTGPIKSAIEAQGKIGEAEEEKFSNQKQQEKDYLGRISQLDNPIDYFNKLQAQQEELKKAVIAGKINPHQYWDSKSTASKISTGIGMLLSGIGSGLTGQPNLAAEFLNRAIDRDIQAQQNNQSQNMNLWQMNNQQFGNRLMANQATKNQYLTMLDAQLEMSKNQASSLEAKQNAALAQYPLQIALKEGQVRMSVFNRLNKPGNVDLDPSQVAGIMIKDPAQLNKAREEIARSQQIKQVYQNMEGAANHLEGQALNGALNPDDTYATASAFAGEIAKLTGARQSPAMIEHIAKTYLPTGITTPGGAAHRAQLRKEFFNSINQSPVMDGNGLPLARFNSTNLGSVKTNFAPPLTQQDKAAIEWAKNPQSKGWNKQKAMKILQMTGGH